MPRVSRKALSRGEMERVPLPAPQYGSCSFSSEERCAEASFIVTRPPLLGAGATWFMQCACSCSGAMGYFFPSIITLLCGLCYLQFAGVPFTHYYFTIPSIVTIALTFSYLISIWRVGPLAARSKPYLLSLPLSWAGWSATFLVGFLGPTEDIPFGSLMHFLVVVGVCLFSGILANKSGVLPSPGHVIQPTACCCALRFILCFT